MFTKDQVLNVEIERLAYGGDGVAKPQNFTVFVPRTAQNDEVSIQITDGKNRFAQAKVLEVLKPSSQRTTPPCAHYDQCGGCHLMHIDPNHFAQIKQQQIVECFERIGGIKEAPLTPLISPKSMLGYRNKVVYHRAKNGFQGYIAHDAHRVVDIQTCPIAQTELDDLWKTLRPLLQPVGASQLPFVSLRKTTTNQVALVLSVTHNEVIQELQNRLDGFLKTHPNIHVFHTHTLPKSFSPFGKDLYAWGEPTDFKERFSNIDFFVEPDLFFQIHPENTQTLIDLTVAWAKNTSASKVLDLFCGSGLFSLPLAQMGIQTLGVDVEHRAILCAQKSAAQANLSGAQFRAGKVDRILEKLIQKEHYQTDHLVLDPPRSGLDNELIPLIDRLSPKHLLYISCSPPSLARDLKKLVALGYKLTHVQGIDMFPYTYHIETVVSLER